MQEVCFQNNKCSIRLKKNIIKFLSQYQYKIILLLNVQTKPIILSLFPELVKYTQPGRKLAYGPF